MAREHYLKGREHAAIKHAVLQQYLELLCFKTLQAQQNQSPSFTYIDGFTGPWSARDKAYADTSFGIALDVLNRVKKRLPNAQVKAIFCEEKQSAYRKLEEYISANAGEVEFKCIPGKVEQNVGEICDFAGPKGFRFAFLDPTGWNVDTSAITPLLKGAWSEVVFNFMAEFINRFPDFEQVHNSYSTLLGNVDWRARFDALPKELSNDEKILRMFRDVLKERWEFRYIVEMPIKKPSRERVFYKLVYGTRSPHGVLVFRDAQAKAEREGHAVAFEAESHKTEDLFLDLTSPDEHAEMVAAAVGVGSRAHTEKLPGRIQSLLKKNGPTQFLYFAASTMETIPVREKDVKSAVRKLREQSIVDYANEDRNGAPSRKSIIRLEV